MAESVSARGIYSFLVVIVSFGIPANFFLLFVTLRSPSLRSNCHLLIGIGGLLDALHLIGTLYQLPMLVSDEGEISGFACCMMQLVPEMGLMGGHACVLCIGLEQLCAVKLVGRYRGDDRKHLLVHLLLISLAGLYADYLIVAFYEPPPRLCTISAPFTGPALVRFSGLLAVLISAALLVYATTTATIVRASTKSKSARRAFGCMHLAMGIDILGWTATIAALGYSRALELNQVNSAALLRSSSVIVYAGIASKPFLYNSISSEHRQAFRRVFARRSTISTIAGLLDDCRPITNM